MFNIKSCLWAVQFLAMAVLPTQSVFAETVFGSKFPDGVHEFGRPVVTPAEIPDELALTPRNSVSAFTDLIPYVLPSPNQNEAGSCLYMATTGMVEWWLARLSGNLAPQSESQLDLSERFLMNLASEPVAQKITDPLTDTVLLFNWNQSKAVLNRDYPFTKGWMKTVNNKYVETAPQAPGADYTTSFNWINHLGKMQAAPIQVPQFGRQLIFADVQKDRWAVGVAPDDIVETVKSLLIKNQAPVTVIYNHYLYWHAANIIGYNDSASTEGCKFTTGFPEYARQEAQTAEQKGDSLRAQRLRGYAQKVEAGMQSEGGCLKTGVFYVRDSLYADEKGEIYDYDRGPTGDEEPYTKKIIQREYQWLKRFSNHAYQILVVQ